MAKQKTVNLEIRDEYDEHDKNILRIKQQLAYNRMKRRFEEIRDIYDEKNAASNLTAQAVVIEKLGRLGMHLYPQEDHLTKDVLDEFNVLVSKNETGGFISTVEFEKMGFFSFCIVVDKSKGKWSVMGYLTKENIAELIKNEEIELVKMDDDIGYVIGLEHFKSIRELFRLVSANPFQGSTIV